MSAQDWEVPPQVLSGDTADIYFVRTVDILRAEGKNPMATMEFFSGGRGGILCGVRQVESLLRRVLPVEGAEVWALGEGEPFSRKEAVLRITAPYQSYGVYETAILGILAQCSGWATAAREIVEAAAGIPVISFGARHVHPLVAGIMDYSAMVGGCVGASSIEGARLSGKAPSGTMPHALIICIGDTVEATLAFDRHMPPEVPRVALVDTFKDEAEESLRVAELLGERLQGVRLDTPAERGRVTPDLVKEVRARLDQAGHRQVKIFVSGGVDVERVRAFREAGAPVDAFGVGSYISSASPIDFTADIHAIGGRPVAKRGRIPGITANPRLKHLL
ncbi:MAG: nicotinate phosphoribosyltransferase [Chloroflexi bacterium]|nr:nicotinate phosphoribosyltransferase [Chloroflexota bacterium]